MSVLLSASEQLQRERGEGRGEGYGEGRSERCDSTGGDASLGGDRDASPAGGTAAEPPPIPQRISSALCLGRGEWAAWELCACVCVE